MAIYLTYKVVHVLTKIQTFGSERPNQESFEQKVQHTIQSPWLQLFYLVLKIIFDLRYDLVSKLTKIKVILVKLIISEILIIHYDSD